MPLKNDNEQPRHDGNTFLIEPVRDALAPNRRVQQRVSIFGGDKLADVLAGKWTAAIESINQAAPLLLLSQSQQDTVRMLYEQHAIPLATLNTDALTRIEHGENDLEYRVPFVGDAILFTAQPSRGNRLLIPPECIVEGTALLWRYKTLPPQTYPPPAGLHRDWLRSCETAYVRDLQTVAGLLAAANAQVWDYNASLLLHIERRCAALVQLRDTAGSLL